MKAYTVVINWAMSNETQEVEWFHMVGHHTYNECRKLAYKHLMENLDLERRDIQLDDLWINEVEVEGYNITAEEV